MSSETDEQPGSRKRDETLSKDGQWRSFPKVPCLLQYVSNSNYYGRIRVNGKLIRESLKTAVWTTAKLRLTDLQKEQRENSQKIKTPKFSDAVELFKVALEQDTSLKPQSRKYRLWCLGKIKKTWPELWDLQLDKITPQSCTEWAAKLNDEIAGQYFNNTIGTIKQVLHIGIKAYKKKGGRVLDNPAGEIKRVRIKPKELHLPESSHFKLLVKNLRTKSGGWGTRIAVLVEFLTYGGMRIHSEAVWVTWDDVDWKRKQIIVRGNPDTGTKNSEIRRVPMLPDMKVLLTRLKNDLDSSVKGPILQVWKCNEALTRACKEIGIPRLTHHDFRHLFATRCIESGVDIPTVSRWLGHKDGGALAMKTYGHLRNEHSQAMAQKVKF